ncbi:MAG: hypothetical protein P8Y68_14200 [Anaerolineales bacterium]
MSEVIGLINQLADDRVGGGFPPYRDHTSLGLVVSIHVGLAPVALDHLDRYINFSQKIPN